MLSKEHGLTVLGVCAVYDLLVVAKLRPRDLINALLLRRRPAGLHLEGVAVLALTTVLCLALRIYVMGAKAPEFSPADNPAADSNSWLTRTLTFFYLPAVNFWLLVCPCVLSFDWSMDAVPLVTSVADPRNLVTLGFFGAFAAAWWRSLACVPVPRTPVARESPTSKLAEVAAWANGGTTATNASTTMLALRSSTARLRSGEASSTHQQQQHQHQHHSSRHRHRRPRDKLHDVSLDDSEATTLALCLLSVPFLPATNLFFYVGFVVAERVLYIPSMGYCLLLGLAVDKAARVAARWAPAARRRAVAAGFTLACALLLVIFSARTLRRNEDWSTEEKLYRAGIPVNPPKAYGNVANILSAKGMKEEAEQAYKMALSYRSNMADVHYNMGILFQEQKRYAEALQAYNRAIQFRPRMAMAHLNMGLVLGILGRKEEAMEIYRKCALLDVTGLKDPRTHEATKTSALFNLGRLLADEGRVSDGIEAYLEAVQKMPSHYQPQSLYNMLGEAYFKLGDWAEAEKWYLAALRAKPDHVPAHLTYGKLLAKSNRVEEAEEMFKRAKGLAPEDCTVYQHFGQFLAESERHEEAAENYIRAASLASHDYEIVFNAANTLRQAGRNKEAENFYRKAVILRPEEATSHMNLGAMLHVNGKLVEAEASYLEALRLKPDDQITQANLNKLRQLLLKVSTRINS